MPSTAPLADADFHDAFAGVDLAGDGSALLLAVSGGPDSTALMQAVAAWPAAPPLFVATVDHGLRAESRAEAEGVAAEAARLGLPHAVLAWEDRPARVSQAAARSARYRLLADHARAVGAGRLATAHTLDDQAETVLMRLADGSGLSGLAGMAPATRRGALLHLRPFLGLPKAALAATCWGRGWRFVEDPSNRDPRFARPRWRALAPLLAAEGLTPARLLRLGARLRRADEALDAAAERLAAETVTILDEAVPPGGAGVVRVDVARLARAPEEIALRVLIRALEAAGAETIRLGRAEAALAGLLAAHHAGQPLRRTLAGRLLALDADGTLSLSAEPPRRRGR